MNQLLLPAFHEEVETVSDFPYISIVMPFEPKMKDQRELSLTLNNALLRAEEELQANFPNDVTETLSEKLRMILQGLDYDTHKKSLAIFVSLVFEKVFYLDMEVQTTITIDNSFGLRQLINSKKEIRQYLLLILGESESKMYFRDGQSLLQVFANRSDSVMKENHEKEKDRGLSFTDIYLRHIDSVLGILLPSFKVPFFVLGNKTINDQFKKITKHSSYIIEYIDHYYDDITLHQLKKAVDPFTRDWAKVKQKTILNQLKNASSQKKVVTGIDNVFSEVMRHQGHLLLVEKDYRYPSTYVIGNEIVDKAVQQYDQSSYVKDTVDDIIEKVLEENGDVEFVDKEVLQGYDHIALIE